MAQRDRGVCTAYSVLVNVSRGKPDFVAPLAPRNLAIFDDAFDHYGALDSLYENDMLESVPVAPGEQSNYQQAIAARRAYELLYVPSSLEAEALTGESCGCVAGGYIYS